MSPTQAQSGPIRLAPGHPKSWGTLRDLGAFGTIANAAYRAAKDRGFPTRKGTSGLTLFRYERKGANGFEIGTIFPELSTEPKDRATPLLPPRSIGEVTENSASLTQSGIYLAGNMSASFAELIRSCLARRTDHEGKAWYGWEKISALVEQAEGERGGAAAVFEELAGRGVDFYIFRVNSPAKTLELSADNQNVSEFISAVAARAKMDVAEIRKGLTALGDHTTGQALVAGVVLADPSVEAVSLTSAPAKHVNQNSKNFVVRGGPGKKAARISEVEKWEFVKAEKGFHLKKKSYDDYCRGSSKDAKE